MTPTPSQDIINLFRQRFIQREDCYPLQIAGNGGYTVIREPITDAIIADHLQGSKTIGLYSSPDSTTKWLCIDIDTMDEAELRKVQQRVSQLGIPFLTEFSGKKGYHIWIFFDKPYPNRIARALGQEIGPSHEIFPKQDHIETGKLGNLVKAPLGTHQVTNNWCHFIGTDLKPLSDQNETLWQIASVNPAEIIPRETSEPRARILPQGSRTDPLPLSGRTQNVPILRDCVYRTLCYGAMAGSRNQIGHILASELRRVGMNSWQTKKVLSSHWNPKNSPPLSDFEINNIVGSAFNGEGYRYGCQKGGALRNHLECVGFDKCQFMSIMLCCHHKNSSN